jgi:predicted metal-dependent TIM-barrel fold hydrolase
MAVESTKVASALKLTMKVGVDSKGKDKVVTKTLSNLKVTAVDEDIFAVGEAISNIKTYPLASLSKEDQYSLSKS